MKKQTKKKDSKIVPLVMIGGLFALLVMPKKTGAPGGAPGGSSAGGSSGLPRGLRNNNIGNIKLNDLNPWLGKIPREQNTDGVFEQFTAKEYGTRAMLMLLRKYYDTYGLKSIYDIIKRYDKNSILPGKQYIPFVTNKMNEISTGFIDRKKLIELAMHMAHFENGQPATTIEELRAVNKKFNIGL